MKRIVKKPKNGQDEWWDEDLKRWMDLNAPEEECKTATTRPPGQPVLAFQYSEHNNGPNPGQSFPDIV